MNQLLSQRRITMTPQKYRQLRGLLHHFRKNNSRITQARTFKRGLFPTFSPHQGKAGRCRWCQLPTGGRAKWHRTCIGAYQNANGQAVTYLWGRRRRPMCPCSRPGTELDHHDALVLAWTSGDLRRLIRAYTLQNLVWLCHACHHLKTRQDLRLLSEMRASQICLAGILTDSADPLMGSQHWILAEGGLIKNIQDKPGQQLTGIPQTTRRRTPFTRDPREASCPRCLTALHYREQDLYSGPRPALWSGAHGFAAPAGTTHILELRNNWVLDERPASKKAGKKKKAKKEQAHPGGQLSLWPE